MVHLSRSAMCSRVTAAADRALTDVVAIAVPLGTLTTHDVSPVTAIHTDRLHLQTEHWCSVTIVGNVRVVRWSLDSSATSVVRQLSIWTKGIRLVVCDAFASADRKRAIRAK